MPLKYIYYVFRIRAGAKLRRAAEQMVQLSQRKTASNIDQSQMCHF